MAMRISLLHKERKDDGASTSSVSRAESSDRSPLPINCFLDQAPTQQLLPPIKNRRLPGCDCWKCLCKLNFTNFASPANRAGNGWRAVGNLDLSFHFVLIQTLAPNCVARRDAC